MNGWQTCEDRPGGVLHQDVDLPGFKGVYVHIEDTEGGPPIRGDHNVVFSGHAVAGGIDMEIHVALGPFPDLAVAEVYVPIVIRHGATVLDAEVCRQRDSGVLGGGSHWDHMPHEGGGGDEGQILAEMGVEVLTDCVQSFIEMADMVPIELLRGLQAKFTRLIDRYPSTLQAVIAGAMSDPGGYVDTVAQMLPDELSARLAACVLRLEAALGKDRGN